MHSERRPQSAPCVAKQLMEKPRVAWWSTLAWDRSPWVHGLKGLNPSSNFISCNESVRFACGTHFVQRLADIVVRHYLAPFLGHNCLELFRSQSSCVSVFMFTPLCLFETLQVNMGHKNPKTPRQKFHKGLFWGIPCSFVVQLKPLVQTKFSSF